SSSINDWLLISTGSHRFDFPGATPFRSLNFRSQYHNCLGLMPLWAAHHSLTLYPLILYSAIRVSHSASRSALVIRKNPPHRAYFLSIPVILIKGVDQQKDLLVQKG
ncbi:hypothetical protein NZJ93_15040, partial [Desulfofundulus thermocisternus]|uniref:hypothetical protein n=1 Tax=Desulfofundulus thermocisternus TaxID=42471 RepID=UPI00217CF295